MQMMGEVKYGGNVNRHQNNPGKWPVSNTWRKEKFD